MVDPNPPAFESEGGLRGQQPHVPGLRRWLILVALFLGLAAIGWWINTTMAPKAKTVEAPKPIETPVQVTPPDVIAGLTRYLKEPPPIAEAAPPPVQSSPDADQLRLLKLEVATLKEALKTMKEKPAPAPVRTAPVGDSEAQRAAKEKRRKEQDARKSPLIWKADEREERERTNLRMPDSRFVVSAGAGVLPCVLETGIDSDVPGPIIARITQNVYDTPTGQYLIVPQGAKLLGDYNTNLLFGAERTQTRASRLTFPNATYYELRHAPVSDLAGYAGLTGDVDHHWWRLAGAVLLTSALRAGARASGYAGYGGDTTITDQISSEMGQTGGQVAQQKINPALSTKPTIRVPPGTECNVLLTSDVSLPKPYPME